MDAIKFFEERKRMCRACYECEGCRISELSGANGCINVDYESQVKIVEEWSKNHPKKTRQSEFLKVSPSVVDRVKVGVLDICPRSINVFHICRGRGKNCTKCRKKYWLKEIEEI